MFPKLPSIFTFAASLSLGGSRCLHGCLDTALDNDNDIGFSDSSSESDDDGWYLNKHPRHFDHLSFAAGMIVNRLYGNQLQSFRYSLSSALSKTSFLTEICSWDLGTCILEGILGPEGIITSRQKSLQAICFTTAPLCSRGEIGCYMACGRLGCTAYGRQSQYTCIVAYTITIL